jgi:hypothetical protein
MALRLAPVTLGGLESVALACGADADDLLFGKEELAEAASAPAHLLLSEVPDPPPPPELLAPLTRTYVAEARSEAQRAARCAAYYAQRAAAGESESGAQPVSLGRLSAMETPADALALLTMPLYHALRYLMVRGVNARLEAEASS